MEKFEGQPRSLQNLGDVARYWKSCLEHAEADDELVAAHMVEVVANEHDAEWSNNPVYSLIFELAASLETPFAGDTRQRQMKWECIRALLSILEKYAS